MQRNVLDVLRLYNPSNPLDHASTIPAPWYCDPQVESLERPNVFSATWQGVGRTDQIREKGQFFTAATSIAPTTDWCQFA